jgi:serine/threonine protein kinase
MYLVFELMTTDLGRLCTWRPFSGSGTKKHVLMDFPHRKTLVIYQMVRGLAYLHSRGIVHRDLKPENVLVNTNFKVKIADFDLTTPTADVLTVGCGSLYWRCPAVLDQMVKSGGYGMTDTYSQGGRPIDLWGLGVMTLDLLAGQPMVRAQVDPGFSERLMNEQQLASVNAFLEDTETGRGRDILEKDFGVEAAAVELLCALLCRDPAERIPAAEALRHPFFDNVEELAARDGISEELGIPFRGAASLGSDGSGGAEADGASLELPWEFSASGGPERIWRWMKDEGVLHYIEPTTTAKKLPVSPYRQTMASSGSWVGGQGGGQGGGE